MIFTLGNWLGLIRILANMVFNMLRYGENESIRKKTSWSRVFEPTDSAPQHGSGNRKQATLVEVGGTHHKFLAKLKET